MDIKGVEPLFFTNVSVGLC